MDQKMLKYQYSHLKLQKFQQGSQNTKMSLNCPMTYGFVFFFIMWSILFIAASFPNEMKGGLLFLLYFSGTIYIIEHVLFYYCLDILEVPEDMHYYMLRLWTDRQAIRHHIEETRDYNSRVIDYNNDVLAGKSPCLPDYQSARAKQFGIGGMKLIACPVFMFFVGKHVIIEYCRRKQTAKVQQSSQVIGNVQNGQVIYVEPTGVMVQSSGHITNQ